MVTQAATEQPSLFDLQLSRGIDLARQGSTCGFKLLPGDSYKEADVVLLWVLVALLLLFAIVGGVAISKFLFLVLIIAVVLALIGFFTRTA